MKIFGSITELFTLVFRKGSANVTLKPDDSQSATITVTIPQTSSNDSLVLSTAPATLANKTISGDSNTLTNIAVGSLKAESANANTVLLRAATTGAVTSGTISNIHVNASAAIADSKLATISTAGKVSNSATTAASSNTASAIVARDASGNFSAGTITATFSGNLTGNVTGNVSGTAANITATSNSTLTSLSSLSLPGSQVSGNISGNAANVTGTVAIANGGTGQTTANAALNALLPSQSTQSGKYLTTDGTNTSWATVSGGGSGQTLYSTIVAASGGNYTSIKSAVDASAENATIFIRNGTYSETLTITLKTGQKLIGESRDGVILNSSAAVSIAYPTTAVWTGSNNSARSNGSPEQGWRTDNTLGALSITGGSTSAVYSGTTGPAVNDEIIIAACKRPFTVTAKNTSTKTLTLSRAWQGGTGGNETNIPYFSSSGTVLSTLNERVTGVYNMTINNSSASMTASVDMQSSMYAELQNCKITSSSTGNTSTIVPILSLRDARFATVNNIELIKTAAGTTTFQSGIEISGMWCNDITNLVIEGCYRGMILNNSSSLGISAWRSNVHAKSIQNCANSAASISGFCEGTFSIDNIQSGDMPGVTGVIQCGEVYSFVRSVVNLGTLIYPFSDTVLITGSNTVVNAGPMFGNVSLSNSSATAGNILILASGTVANVLTINNSSTVFIGNVSYQSLSGSPVKNNGFDIP